MAVEARRPLAAAGAPGRSPGGTDGTAGMADHGWNRWLALVRTPVVAAAGAGATSAAAAAAAAEMIDDAGGGGGGGGSSFAAPGATGVVHEQGRQQRQRFGDDFVVVP